MKATNFAWENNSFGFGSVSGNMAVVPPVAGIFKAAGKKAARKSLEESVAKKVGSTTPGVVAISNVRAKVLERIDHIMKVEFNASGTRFSGVHSKKALDDHPHKTRTEIDNANEIRRGAGEPYEVKIEAQNARGEWVTKSGHGGKSTFFPDLWDPTRIIEEVEHAVKYNKGRVSEGYPNEFYGHSKDGKVKIHFYLNESTGEINSYFPSLDNLIY